MVFNPCVLDKHRLKFVRGNQIRRDISRRSMPSSFRKVTGYS